MESLSSSSSSPYASNGRGGKVPPGITLIRSIRGKDISFSTHRAMVLLITFLAYACYHASRKPLSIVKTVLDPEDPLAGKSPSPAAGTEIIGWNPFNGKLGNARLGEIDLAFLAFYAIGMFYAGRLGDRLDLRMFLTFGMISSGSFVCLFGAGYWLQIHAFSYYFFVQAFAGLLSATGWPAVVAVVANWCGKTKRGLIMGIWNAHTSLGNIVGSLAATSALHLGWGWSFVLPGVLIMAAGLLVFLFLVVEPVDVGLPSPYELDDELPDEATERDEESCTLLALDTTQHVPKTVEDVHEDVQVPFSVMRTDSPFGSAMCSVNANSNQTDLVAIEHQEVALSTGKTQDSASNRDIAIGFLDACKIPGVASYAVCLFFVKMVAYTFLFWLPFYIRHTEIAGKHLTDKMAGNISTLFDIGGVAGGILAGHISDKYNARATVAAGFLYCIVPSLFIFRIFASASLVHLIIFLILLGALVNGPYALITTAVSADLGTNSSLQGNAKALATVTAIIDGTGSVGAAVGPFLTGHISVRSWNGVFLMLAISSLIAGILLIKLVVAEVNEKQILQRTFAMEELRYIDQESLK